MQGLDAPGRPDAREQAGGHGGGQAGGCLARAPPRPVRLAPRLPRGGALGGAPVGHAVTLRGAWRSHPLAVEAGTPCSVAMDVSRLVWTARTSRWS